jgi:hypothetical protein
MREELRTTYVHCTGSESESDDEAGKRSKSQ